MCYGFVRMANNQEAYNAVIALNGMQMEQKRMKVAIARPRGTLSTLLIYYTF